MESDDVRQAAIELGTAAAKKIELNASQQFWYECAKTKEVPKEEYLLGWDQAAKGADLTASVYREGDQIKFLPFKPYPFQKLMLEHYQEMVKNSLGIPTHMLIKLREPCILDELKELNARRAAHLFQARLNLAEFMVELIKASFPVEKPNPS